MTSRHAEVEQVWPRDGRVLVIGRIVGTAPTPLGRHLDDIPDKKTVMTFPAQTGEARTGAVSVKPYYTVMQNLSLISRPVQA